MKKGYFLTNWLKRNAALPGLLVAALLATALPPNTFAQTAAPSAAAAKAEAEEYAAAKNHARATAKEWLARGIPGVTLAVRWMERSSTRRLWIRRPGAARAGVANDEIQDCERFETADRCGADAAGGTRKN